MGGGGRSGGRVSPKEEKLGRKGKNWEGSFTLPLLTERAVYANVKERCFVLSCLVQFLSCFFSVQWTILCNLFIFRLKWLIYSKMPPDVFRLRML